MINNIKHGKNIVEYFKPRGEIWFDIELHNRIPESPNSTHNPNQLYYVKPFRSYLKPVFETEGKWEALIFIFMQIKLIFNMKRLALALISKVRVFVFELASTTVA